MDHGSESITFYVQKHEAHLVVCSSSPAGSRQAAGNTRICETHLLSRGAKLVAKRFPDLSNGVPWWGAKAPH